MMSHGNSRTHDDALLRTRSRMNAGAMISKTMPPMLAIGLVMSCLLPAAFAAEAPGAKPPTEKIQAAIDKLLDGVHGGFFAPFTTCVGLHSQAQMGGPGSAAFRDTQPDMTPAGYLNRITPANDPKGTRKAQLEYLEKTGHLKSSPGDQGGSDFTLTWKGYAATFNTGCLRVDSPERRAKITGITRRQGAGANIYEVAADMTARETADWAQTAEFNRLFPQLAERLNNPEKYTFIVEQKGIDFTVQQTLNQEKSRINITPNAVNVSDQVIKSITRQRVIDTLSAHVQSELNARADQKLCIRLPLANEVDQMLPVTTSAKSGPRDIAARFDVMRIAGRDPGDLELKQLGHTLLQRLESLGLVQAASLNNIEFKGRAATGGFRYELNQESAKLFAPGLQGCYPLNNYRLEELLRFEVDKFTSSVSFLGRLSVQPLNEATRRIIDTFGNLARAQSIGVPVLGTMLIKNDQLTVIRSNVDIPKFKPAPTTTPPATAAKAPPAAAPTAPTLRPGGRAPTAADDIEVHAVNVYEGKQEKSGASSPHLPPSMGTVNIRLHQTAKPIGLFLSANDPVTWRIELLAKARLNRIITSSGHPQRIIFVNLPATPVTTVPNHPDYKKLAEEAFGIKPSTIQNQYTGTTFDVGLP